MLAKNYLVFSYGPEEIGTLLFAQAQRLVSEETKRKRKSSFASLVKRLPKPGPVPSHTYYIHAIGTGSDSSGAPVLLVTYEVRYDAE